MTEQQAGQMIANQITLNDIALQQKQMIETLTQNMNVVISLLYVLVFILALVFALNWYKGRKIS